MRVQRVLGFGFLEAVYRNALEYELTQNGFQTQREAALEVRYEGIMVGNYFADLIVNGELIVEIKVIQAIAKAHEAQLVNYLTATGIEHGLLLNFGAKGLEFRRKFRTPRSSNSVNFVNSV